MTGLLAVLAQTNPQDMLSTRDVTIAGLLIAALMVIGGGAVRRWWVPGSLYEDAVKRADKMEERAFKATDAMEIAINTAEKLQKENEGLRHELERYRTPHGE